VALSIPAAFNPWWYAKKSGHFFGVIKTIKVFDEAQQNNWCNFSHSFDGA